MHTIASSNDSFHHGSSTAAVIPSDLERGVEMHGTVMFADMHVHLHQ